MSDYQPLLNDSDVLSPYLDEETKAGSYVHPRPALPGGSENPSTSLKLVFMLCLVLSASLAGANIWTNRLLSRSVADALPSRNVMELERADQYDGLSDHSRQMLYYHGEDGLPQESNGN